MEDRSEKGEQSIGATPFTGYGRPSRTFARGRVCSEPGCETKLSIYNGSGYCSVHERSGLPLVAFQGRSAGARFDVAGGSV